MMTVLEARQRARKQLETNLGRWAAARSAEPITSTIFLSPPTEKEMRADEAAAESWATAWSRLELGDGADVEWATRSWRSIGRQRVPVRLRLADADAVAAFAGGSPAREWAVLTRRVAALQARLGDSDDVRAAARRHADSLLRYDDRTFDQVVDVTTWLLENSVDGLRPRQLPIRGVDSKWFQAHRSVVTALCVAVSGSLELGIVDAEKLVRVRVLDASILPGGATDFAAAPTHLAQLDLAPRVVLVVENLETVLAMPPWPGAVVVHGSGYAVDVVGSLPWVHRSPVVYWGDLDSHGFVILHKLRSAHLSVTSVLMDEVTLLEHRDLWVPEPKPSRAALASLTTGELAALERLRLEGDVRLEQERVPWSFALESLTRTMARAAVDGPR